MTKFFIPFLKYFDRDVILRYLFRQLWYTTSDVKKMKRVLVNLTEKLLKEIDTLVEEKVYSSRSEAFRDAVRLLIEKSKIKEIDEKLGLG